MNDFYFLFPLNILPAFFILSLGLYALMKNREDYLARLFFYFCLCTWFNGVTAAFYRTALNVADAQAWNAFYTTSFFLGLVVFVHFCVAFNYRKPIEKVGLYLLLYLPVAAIFLVDRLTDWIDLEYKRSSFGYFFSTSGPLDWLRVLLLVTYVLAGISQLYNAYRKAHDPMVKKQAQMIMLGMFFPLILGTISDELLPQFTSSYVPLLTFSFFFMTIFLFIAVTRYRFAHLSPSAAVETTVDSIPDAIVATDLAGNINFCNPPAADLFQDPLINKNLADFSDTAEIKEKTEAFLAGRKDPVIFETRYNKSAGPSFPAEVNCSPVRGKEGEVFGIMWNIADLSENFALKQALVKKQAELKDKIREIGRLNEFMNGRDARLEELKREANDYRAQLGLLPH